MNTDQINEVSFQIIMNAGDARSTAMESLAEAKKGDIDKAKKLIKEARNQINNAHQYQTSLINAVANGEKNEINVLLIHSQDHLMNAMTVLDLAEEFIDLYDIVYEKL